MNKKKVDALLQEIVRLAYDNMTKGKAHSVHNKINRVQMELRRQEKTTIKNN